MAVLAVEGGRRLSGRVSVEGNKNSALPLLAACLLTEEECILTNVPRIRIEIPPEAIARPASPFRAPNVGPEVAQTGSEPGSGVRRVRSLTLFLNRRSRFGRSVAHSAVTRRVR